MATLKYLLKLFPCQQKRKWKKKSVVISTHKKYFDISTPFRWKKSLQIQELAIFLSDVF